MVGEKGGRSKRGRDQSGAKLRAVVFDSMALQPFTRHLTVRETRQHLGPIKQTTYVSNYTLSERRKQMSPFQDRAIEQRQQPLKVTFTCKAKLAPKNEGC